MPCHSTIATKLRSLDEAERAARDLKAEVVRQGDVLRITLDGVELVVWRQGEEIVTNRLSTREEAVLKRVTVAYAERKIKAVAAKRGFTVTKSAGKKEYALVKYG